MVTPEAIRAARATISGVALRSPLVRAPTLSRRCGRDIRLKLETVQPIGAFKIRGAANALARFDEKAKARGVICASTGNHGRAIAFAAGRLGIPATICMSGLVPKNKVEAIRAIGAEVRIVGNSQDDAQAEVERLAATSGLVEIPPFDHPDVIAGQGTIGLELLEDFPDLDCVLVPLSGGGLIAGIATAIKHVSPKTRIVGVSMERGAAMHASLAAGRPVDVVEEPTWADSLGGGIGLANRWTFRMVRDLVDEIVLVPERDIAKSMRTLFLDEGWVAEGAGAIGIAALDEARAATIGDRVAIIISGKNVDMTRFQQAITPANEVESEGGECRA